MLINILAILVLLHSVFTTARSDTPNLSLSLSGQTLKCCFIISDPFVFSEEYASQHNNDSGWAGNYFERLKEKLKFSCENHYINKTYDDFIDGGLKCGNNSCQCNIAVGSFWQTTRRLANAIFIPPHGHDSFYIVTEESNIKQSDLSRSFFVRAFEGNVWYAILGLFTFFTILHLLDERFAPARENRRPGNNTDSDSESNLENDPWTMKVSKFIKKVRYLLLKHHHSYRIRRAIQATFSKFVGFPLNDLSEGHQTMRMWFLSYAITLSGIFLILVYEAAMIATLLQESNDISTLNVYHLHQCHIPDTDFCFLKNNGIKEYWENVLKPQPCRDDHASIQLREIDDREELLERVKNKTCKYMLADGGLTGTSINEKKYCGKLQIIGGPFVTREVSFVVPKIDDDTNTNNNNTRLDELTMATLELQSNGIFNKSLQEYISEDRSNCNPNSGSIVDFNRLRYFFYFIFSICALLFLEMVFDPQDPMHTFDDQQEALQQQQLQNEDIEAQRRNIPIQALVLCRDDDSSETSNSQEFLLDRNVAVRR